MSTGFCIGSEPEVCFAPLHPDVYDESEIPEPPLPLGYNDGTIFPRSYYSPDVPDFAIAQEALDQPNLRGAIKLLIVLVNFKDLKINNPEECKKYITNQFFSKNAGTVNQYFDEVSGAKVSFSGDIFGPYDLPQDQSYYTNGNSGKGGKAGGSTQVLGFDSITAAINADIDLHKYDNPARAKGWVDGFVVVHAGQGAEVMKITDRPNHIWSCKWSFPQDKVVTQKKNDHTTQVFTFLTIPEIPALGLTCHELGHLLFGWPDFYDTSYIKNASRGIGAWCLMGTGCWGSLPGAGQGTTPAHPSAWCKADQEWVDVVETLGQSDNIISIKDVKSLVSSTSGHGPSGRITKIWPKGQKGGKEYFLLENRVQSGYDQSLPGGGLLIWHVDDNVPNNRDDKPHYRVALVNADGAKRLKDNGDASNIWPGTLNKRELNSSTTPNSKSYDDKDSGIGLANISDASDNMQMKLTVKQV